MIEFGTGPLFALYWYGGLCPCLEKEEDKTARHAMRYVNSTAKRVRWATSSGGAGGRRTSASQFFGSLLEKTKKLGRADGGGGDSSESSSGADNASGNKGDVVARLRIQDNVESSEPEVFVDPIPVLGPDGKPLPSSISYKLNIALRRIDRVVLERDCVVLLAKPQMGGPTGEERQPPKELVRFVPLNEADTSVPVTDESRNLLVHHLAVLVEWERQRRRAEGYHVDDDDEEDKPNFLTARAQKAAHFAKRELELRETRREREKRKAKLVAESGGLKYTALAMANKEVV